MREVQVQRVVHQLHLGGPCVQGWPAGLENQVGLVNIVVLQQPRGLGAIRKAQRPRVDQGP